MSLWSWFSSERWGKLQMGNTAAFVLNVFIVQTSNFGWYGATNGEMSRKYQTFVTPAGWAFAIWGLIYTMETVAWTLAFAQEQITLSCGLMAGIYLTLGMTVRRLFALRDVRPFSTKEYWLYLFPFTLHFGWITAASIISGNLILRANGSALAAQLGAASLSVGLATLSAAAFAFLRRDPVHPCVIAWALFALGKELQNDQNPLPYITTHTPATDGLSWAASAGSVLAIGMAALGAVLYCIGARDAHAHVPTGVPAAPHGGRGRSLLDDEGEVAKSSPPADTKGSKGTAV